MVLCVCWLKSQAKNNSCCDPDVAVITASVIFIFLWMQEHLIDCIVKVRNGFFTGEMSSF